LAVLLLTGTAWCLFSWALLSQHRAYNSNGWDLSWFDQIIWNTAHGRPFATSFVEWNFLGEHLEPILLFFAIVYRIVPDPEVLLLTQAAVTSWAAVPLYLAARRVLASAAAGALVAATYLVSVSLHTAVLFDFHPEVMGTACIFGAFAFLVSRRPGWAVATISTAFLLKEDAALVAAGFVWLLWRFGSRRWAVGLTLASVIYFGLVAGVLMPAVRGGPGGPHARYAYLGTTPPTAALNALRHPERVGAHLAGREQRRAALVLYGSLALLPLADPAGLMAVPLLVAHLLSEHPSQHRLALHYGILPFALALVAAVLAIRRIASTAVLQSFWQRLVAVSGRPDMPALLLAGGLLVTSGINSFVNGPFGRKLDLTHYQRTPHSMAVDRVIAAVPPVGSVSAQSGLLPHLSQREQVWEFPPLHGAEYVVVDRTAWWEVHGRPGPELDYHAVLASLPSQGYCLLQAEDGVELYARPDRCGGAGVPSPRAGGNGRTGGHGLPHDRRGQ
jgi:uncharacterized membrane protein